ncbi:unnamed protein product [Aphanomyces euteiches]
MPQAQAKSQGKKTLKEKQRLTKQQAALAKTAAATRRKQEQRAREKAEKTELEVAEKTLLGEIDKLRTKFVWLSALPQPVKDTVLVNRQLVQKRNAMKQRVDELYDLMSMLSKWVFAQTPHEGIKPKPSRMETTLLGHAECRNYGQVWLCQKALHMALTAHPYEPFVGKVDDNLVSWTHQGEDATGTSLEALQLHSQFSVMGDYKDVASVVWSLYVSSSPHHVVEIIDKVDDEVAYFTMEYGPLKSKFVNLAGVFRLQHRIVITFTTIAFDERFPMQDGESRTHGFGWMILDEMGEGVTICRQSRLQFTPVNKNGQLTLEEIGQLVHYKPRPHEPRETIIGKYQAMVENAYVLLRGVQIRSKFPIVY